MSGNAARLLWLRCSRSPASVCGQLRCLSISKDAGAAEEEVQVQKRMVDLNICSRREVNRTEDEHQLGSTTFTRHIL
jgi:hypothetical protein